MHGVTHTILLAEDTELTNDLYYIGLVWYLLTGFICRMWVLCTVWNGIMEENSVAISIPVSDWIGISYFYTLSVYTQKR